MANLFKDILSGSESLFKNPEALDPEFIPKLIPYRELDQKYIASCIKPLFQKRNGKNLIITGPPGVGKTVAVKHIFKELEETTDEVIPIYINCWKKDTSFKLISAICEQIDYKWVQNKRTDELFKACLDIINKKSVVFCFDEIDKLQEFDLIYSILEDIHRKTILFITNHKDFIEDIDPRLKSRLMLELLEFKQYNLQETDGILRQRVESAFPPSVLENDAFKLIVNKTFEIKDIRVGLFLLREAGTIAEDSSSRKILLKHVEEAVKRTATFKEKNIESLGEEEKMILNLIKENSGKNSNEIFTIYAENGGTKTYRTFYRKVKDLADGNFIKMKEFNKAGRYFILEY